MIVRLIIIIFSVLLFQLAVPSPWLITSIFAKISLLRCYCQCPSLCAVCNVAATAVKPPMDCASIEPFLFSALWFLLAVAAAVG